METLKPISALDLNSSRQVDETPAAWTARRHCAECANLALAGPSPEIPDNLEPVIYSFDDPMIQGSHRLVKLFACISCGRNWSFNADRSDWTLSRG